jgi:hypothetical protein
MRELRVTEQLGVVMSNSKGWVVERISDKAICARCMRLVRHEDGSNELTCPAHWTYQTYETALTPYGSFCTIVKTCNHFVNENDLIEEAFASIGLQI